MKIAVRNLQKIVKINRSCLKNLVKKICNFLNLNKGYLSLVFADNEVVKELNRRYLKKNNPTDVLAFDLTDNFQPQELSAEVIISVEKAEENSKIFSTDLREELLLYIIHGLLHLSGFEDKTSLQKKEMRKKEKEIIIYLHKKEKKLFYSFLSYSSR